VQNIEIQNTGHEIHGNTAKANYRNPSALAELALASAGPGPGQGRDGGTPDHYGASLLR